MAPRNNNKNRNGNGNGNGNTSNQNRNSNSNNNNNNNNGNRMNIDSQKSAPAGNNSNGPQCHTCKQFGHKANQCPSGQTRPNNQSQAQNTQTNNGGQQGNRSNQNSQNSQNNQSRPTCGKCGRNNHTTENCRSNSNNSNQQNRQNNGNANNNNNNNANTNTHQNGPQRKQELNGIPTEGYIFKGVLPQYTGSEKYCPNCNRTDHFQHECENPEALSTLMFSKICCWKCCYRGHTASDCRNPQAQRCATCQKPGHKTDDCRDRVAAALRAPGLESEKRFLWTGDFIQGNCGQVEQYHLEQRLLVANDEDEVMDDMEYTERVEDIAAKQIIQWPQQTQSMHHIPLLNDITRAARAAPVIRQYPQRRPNNLVRSYGYKVQKPQQAPCANFRRQEQSLLSGINPDLQPLVLKAMYRIEEESLTHHQRLIRAHVDRSAKLYKKENYNNAIRNLSCAIEEQQTLSPKRKMQLLCSIAQGCQFWRDPKAMEALVTGLVPWCHACGERGVILDRHLRQNPIEAAEGTDVLVVQDFEDWGLFVAFECKCCNHGYSWVPSLNL